MDVVVFGASRLASLAWAVLTADGRHRVVAFTVDRSYLAEEEKHGLPVVPFEELERHFPPRATALVAPLGRHTATGLAAERRRAASVRGYASLSHVSARATVAPGVTVGTNCMIYDGAVVESFVTLGDDIMVRGSCHLSHHVAIAGSCFLAPRVTLAGGVTVGERCFIGIGAIVHSNVRIAPGCVVAAGARLTRDTEPDGVYAGAPAIRRAIPPGRIGQL
jgi:sugar O-acyltransferase (sialic acid O-acetyltransferase NeuD family)